MGRTMTKKKLLRVLGNQKGMTGIEILLIAFFSLILVTSGMHMLAASVKHSEVDFAARRVARLIEVEGGVTPLVYTTFESLKKEIDVPDAKLQITDVNYFNAAEKTIQLKEMFKVHIVAQYHLKVLDPFGMEPIYYDIPLVGEKSGMSEVYHKP